MDHHLSTIKHRLHSFKISQIGFYIGLTGIELADVLYPIGGDQAVAHLAQRFA